jgi:ribonuclease P protein component
MPKAANDVMDRVTRRGTRLSRRGFALYYLKTLRPPRPRIVISQKVDKRATVRNRLRRQIREIIKSAQLTNCAIVIITKKELLDLSFAELKQLLGNTLSQIK